MAPAAVGSGQVTDSQVAFMVECYLRDSHFNRTLEEFRSEAARILHPLRSIPKGARSLGAVLNDYVALKEEQISAASEKARVEDLFQGLQQILGLYLSGIPKQNAQVKAVAMNTTSPPSLVSPVQASESLQMQSHAVPGPIVDGLAKDKLTSNKRKSQGAGMPKSSGQSLQLVDPSSDLAKKPRRGSKRLSPISPSEGNMAMLNVPSSTECLSGNRMVQPATPPMSSTTSFKPQQQQCFAASKPSVSPQLSPLTSGTTNCNVSPKQTSDSTINADSVHQDPCTPPPSASKSSLNANSSSFDSMTTKATSCSTVAPAKPTSVQQHGREPMVQLPTATSHYSLRGHKKYEISCVLTSNAQSVCNPKPTRKKAGNSKCRLLDFSSAAASSIPPEEMTPPVQVSPSDCTQVGSHQHIVVPSVASPPVLQHEHVSDLSSSSANPVCQDSQMAEFSLSCDTFSFDELFSLELDATLISELEDLTGLSGGDADLSSCLRSGEMTTVPCSSGLSNRGVLTEMNINLPGDEVAGVMPHNNSPSSPIKQQKLATPAVVVDVDDKENMPGLVVLAN